MSSGVNEEEWVKAAMSDDTMVVDLLVRLHHGAAAPPPPPPPSQHLKPLEWSVRQRRSRPQLLSINSDKKHQQQARQRASPTTPLSWSGATSLSGGSGGGGSEESSRPHVVSNLSSSTRSKSNVDSEKPSSKRSRKKKTLAELKDEESLLLKERRDLKRELAALQANLEKQRASNEKLKRMKTELQPLPDREMTCISEASISGHVSGNNDALQRLASKESPQKNADAAPGSTFMLPDLNMPFEEDLCPGVICGVS